MPMHYNPFYYIHSEKDILKLVNTLIANTKGEGEKSSEDFWVKVERLLYCALIGYIYDAAPAGVEDLGQGDDVTKFFARDNNFYYITRQKFEPSFDYGDYYEFPAKASGNDCFNAFPGINDWYETVKLNYGVDYGDGSRHFDPVPSTYNTYRNCSASSSS